MELFFYEIKDYLDYGDFIIKKEGLRPLLIVVILRKIELIARQYAFGDFSNSHGGLTSYQYPCYFHRVDYYYVSFHFSIYAS